MLIKFFCISVAHLNLGLVYSSLGHKSESFQIFSGILSIEDDGLKDPKTHLQTQISARINMARIQLDRGQNQEAIKGMYVKESSSNPVVQGQNSLLLFWRS